MTSRRSAIIVTSIVGVVATTVACGDDTGGGSSSGTSSSSSSSSGATSSSSGGVAGPGSTHAGCAIFPSDSAWNTDVSGAEVDTALMTSIFPQMNGSKTLHPDWGTVSDGYGIPITVGKASTPAPITFNTSYGSRESDKLPCADGASEYCYPIPLDARIEGGGDKHILFIAQDNAPDKCVLYELYSAAREGNGFNCGSAAIWHLDSNAIHLNEGDTSADAAGLPILSGLVRREEVERGEIAHAIRFTMSSTQNGYIRPATHAAGKDDPSLPPMGLRLRLKADFSEAGLTGASLVVIKAMKKYGLILADNGSDWYISGESHESWGAEMDDVNAQLKKVKGADFEIVKTGSITKQPD